MEPVGLENTMGLTNCSRKPSGYCDQSLQGRPSKAYETMPIVHGQANQNEYKHTLKCGLSVANHLKRIYTRA